MLVLLLLAYELRQGLVVFAARFADPSFSMAAVAVVLLFGAWRLVAVVHAFMGGERRKTHRLLDRVVVAALTAIIVISHVGAGYVFAVINGAGSSAFNQDGSGLIVAATPGPGLASGQTPGPSSVPLPTPVVGGRVTILLTGIDSDPSRGEALYDSIMVVSYNPSADSVQMVSVPRDSASFPFYFGGVDKPSVKINSLPTYVRNGWIKSPDSPYMTLVKEVSYLVGIPINYYAVMNLNGFVTMINKVGGIDVVNPSAINDPSYATAAGTVIGFSLAAGPQHLDGDHALAYVRSRHGAGNSDWARSSRQQQVLVALLHKMAEPAQLLALPGLISTLGSSITTTFPANKVADYVAIGQDIPSRNISQVVLGPPYTITGISSVNAADCLLNAKVAALFVQLFGSDSLWYGKPAPADTCP